MSYAFLKEPFLDMASSVWAMPEEQWIDDSPTSKDIQLLEKEARGQSPIDEINLRGEMVTRWKDGQVNLHVKELPGRTRLIFLGTDEQWQEIPWTLWSRIMQGIAHPVGHILLYAHPSKRTFPKPNETPIGPSNINAGYSYLCEQSLVVIYRFEEATRVLLHELLHTACFDSEKHTSELEAHTEAWTELLLCAILSKGSSRMFKALWLKQCEWITAQTQILKVHYTIHSPREYAWRYTVGKHEVLEAMGFMLPCKPYKGSIGLRFTTPEWD
jgi:hypothetical protein